MTVPQIHSWQALSGNPAMNLIEGSVAGGIFTAANTEIPGLNAADQNITLGFRAEDARVVHSGGQINAPIYTLELVGGCQEKVIYKN